MAVPLPPGPLDPPAPEVVAFYGVVLADLQPRIDELVGEIAARIVERIPALAGDERLLQAIERTSRTNIHAVVDLLVEPGLSPDPPAGAVTLAGAYVRAEQPLSVLIESYHVGQALFLDTWLEALGGATDDAALLGAATLHSYRRVVLYLDAVLARIVEQYLVERRQWQARRLRRQWQIVQSLLDDSFGEGEAAASTALGYDLARRHLAAVVTGGAGSERRDEEGLDPDSLLAVARTLAERFGAGHALSLSAGPGLVYTWIPVGESIVLDGIEVDPGVRVALGAPAVGTAGFRLSHQQAQWTHALVRRLPAPPAVASYGELAALTLLRDDPAQLRAFAAHQLGELTRRDHETAILRETLRVALAEGLNASSAARRLNVHKNTVLYRLRSAEQLLGHPVAEQRLELELALRVVEWWGEELLG